MRKIQFLLAYSLLVVILLITGATTCAASGEPGKVKLESYSSRDANSLSGPINKIELQSLPGNKVEVKGVFIDGGCITAEKMRVKSTEKLENGVTVVNMVLDLEGQPCKAMFMKEFQAVLQMPVAGTYKVRLWLNELYYPEGEKLRDEQVVTICTCK